MTKHDNDYYYNPEKSDPALILSLILEELREIKEILNRKSKKSTCKEDCSVVMNGGLGK